MKNAFNFTSKAFFVLKIFGFFSKLFQQTLAIHILPNISRSKKNRQRKLEYNLRTQIVEEKLVPENFLEN